MKITKILCCGMLLFFFYCSSAFALITCPTVAEISGVKFKHAVQFDEAWILSSDMYHQNTLWRLIFVFGLSSDKEKPKQALMRGQDLFNNKVTLLEPSIDLETGKVVCYYSNSNSYSISSEVAY